MFFVCVYVCMCMCVCVCVAVYVMCTCDVFYSTYSHIHSSPLSPSQVGKKLNDFLPVLDTNADVAALRHEIEAFARGFPMPGLGFD